MADATWITFKRVSGWTPTVGVNATTSITFNSIYQPFAFQTGASAPGTQQWSNFYSKYYIDYAFVEIKVVTSVVEAAELCVYASEDSTAVATVGSAAEQRFSKMMYLSGSEWTGQSMSLGMSVSKLLGRKPSGVNWQAELDSTAPTNKVYFHLVMNFNDQTNDGVEVIVTLWQHTRMYYAKVLSA